ncbi:hypothetical protein [unidentified bacterial endosymbiont]|uniref:hypothetical protein n=1 Tax=unidentified bacterial endosymbiont TaxID=2355 RepID=UPI0020A06AB5|nr:hypothetical protein [unidentified bacterial endosymbiont]
MNDIPGGININPAVNKQAEKMSAEQSGIFERAFADTVGIECFPLLYVGNQLVAGQLHIFIATKRLVYPGAQTTLTKVVIYQNLENEISVHSISDI